MVRIVIADDHAIVREGLIPLIEHHEGLAVVGEADNGIDAVKLVEQHRPDVAVVDILMPLLGGLEVARQTRQRSPNTRVIILSAYSDEKYVQEALRVGARGYVLKEARPRDLIAAITEVAAGRRYLSPPLTEAALDAYTEKARQAAADDPYERLTTREREVLHLTADGLTAAAIAKLLGIGERTVESHRANLMRKLGLHRTADLIRFAAERGSAVSAPAGADEPGGP